MLPSITENLRQAMSRLLVAAAAIDTREWPIVRESLCEVQARCARVLRILEATRDPKSPPFNAPEH